jgi:hypothetical protein
MLPPLPGSHTLPPTVDSRCLRHYLGIDLTRLVKALGPEAIPTAECLQGQAEQKLFKDVVMALALFPRQGLECPWDVHWEASGTIVQ